MRLAMILSSTMIGAILPMYIISHGLRAGIPLFISLACAVIGGMVAE